MELKIKEITFPQAIEFNFDEIKAELEAKIEDYKNLVYTADQIGEAKKDRATLNKFTTALEDERKRIKNECLQPYQEFERKIKNLVEIVNTATASIDTQVKTFEEQKKAEKLEKIKEMFREMYFPDFVTFDAIFDKNWLNASTSYKAINDAMGERKTTIETDLETLSELPEFGFEASAVYKTTLDMNKALNEAKRMSEIAKAKAEAEKKKAEEEKRKAEEEKAKAEKQPEEIEGQYSFTTPESLNQYVEQAKEVETGKVRQWIKFQANLTVEDAAALKEFFNSRNIEFKAI